MENRILLTGASGYVGGRLLERLQNDGLPFRCLSRKPDFLRQRLPDADIVQGDVLDPKSLRAAMNGIHTAYYLVHSMGAGSEFEQLDREAATNFAIAANSHGVRKIVYLGGLGDEDDRLSPHLRSRHEVGRLLAGFGVPVVELRASVVIGSGSLSFEMIRALVERLPFMVTPRWVSVGAQPIAIDDLLDCLMRSRQMDEPGHTIIEIGGRDTTTYRELMKEYGRQRGLKRMMIPVPVLTPRLSSLWLRLVTPRYSKIGRTLIDSLRHPTTVQRNEKLPAAEFLGYRDAVRAALTAENKEFDATPLFRIALEKGRHRFPNRLIDHRSIRTEADPDACFATILRIGGTHGWYFANILWRIRGMVDRMLGGVGMRRGRRDPDHLEAGDFLDCWRVQFVEPGRRLRLVSEMKLPGRAWLEFYVEREGDACVIHQTAVFDPLGLFGRLYWYGIFPVHVVIFRGMLTSLVRRAQVLGEMRLRPVNARQIGI